LKKLIVLSKLPVIASEALRAKQSPEKYEGITSGMSSAQAAIPSQMTFYPTKIKNGG
jgi:hypothetical protein